MANFQNFEGTRFEGSDADLLFRIGYPSFNTTIERDAFFSAGVDNGQQCWVDSLGYHPTYMDGRWTYPPGLLVVSVFQTSTQPIASATDAQVINLTLEHQDYGVFSSNQFVCDVPGWYEFGGGVGYGSNTTGYRMCWLRKNGTDVPGSVQQLTNAGGVTALGIRTVPMFCDNGDIVQLWTRHTAGVSLGTTVSATYGYASNLWCKYMGYT